MIHVVNYLPSKEPCLNPGEGFRGGGFHVGLEVKTITLSFARTSHSNPGESRCGLVVKAINLSLIQLSTKSKCSRPGFRHMCSCVKSDRLKCFQYSCFMLKLDPLIFRLYCIILFLIMWFHRILLFIISFSLI